MTQIETLARQAWQLRQQGYSIDDIADAMSKPTSAIERWVMNWARIVNQAPPWYDGLDIHTVTCLRHAGLDSREAVVKAWQRSEIKRGSPSGIGVVRLLEIRSWLDAIGVDVAPVTSKAVIVDLTPEAEAVLHRLKAREGRNTSQLISELLIRHEAGSKER
ncbi:hypothetical protein LWH48_06525 [Halomonas sp. G15]|uniref:hypothetical protein n=1 Tax=Halomonas sp. G15 TaxID=2903521 RepID=UPI001E370485|nr:hypothetical protein [Halomonas sp. G15]MCE0732457.1 hypothetical protein [Halomonas sp. G15]